MISLRCLIRTRLVFNQVATPLIQYVCFSSRVDERLFKIMRPQELYHNVKTILQQTTNSEFDIMKPVGILNENSG